MVLYCSCRVFLPYSFPQWFFFVVYQVGGVTTIIFCYIGQSFKKSKMMSWCFDLSINSLVNFMMTYKELPGWRRPVEALRGNDRGLGCWLRTWWIRHSQSVRPRRRCETASHKCCRPKGNRRTKVELLLPRTKKVRVLLVSKNNTLGNFAGRKIEEERRSLRTMLCRIKRGNRPWICIFSWSAVGLRKPFLHAISRLFPYKLLLSILT